MSVLQACLLAAGKGRRAGGPKAWKIHEGRALLERQVEFLAAYFGPARVAISIQSDWLPRCLALCPAAVWVPVDPQASPLASLQALLSKLGAGWTFMHHVDMPVWEPALFKALEREIAEAQRAGMEAVVPARENRRGHPVLFSPGVLQELMALDARADRLDRWLRARKVRVVEADFPCVLENWNFFAPA